LQADQYVYEGLEAFEKRLRRLANDVDYLVVWDRTDRKTEDSLGRFTLTLADALPYLEQSEELAESEISELDALVEEVDEDTEEFNEDDDARAERLLGRVPGPADYAVAAGKWLRDIAVRNMGGDELRRFRVRAYSPKAARVMETATFSCRDTDAEPESAPLALREPAQVDLPMPVPTFEAVETHASGRGMRALGDCYTQFGHLVVGTFNQLQNINNAVVNNLHRDLQSSRRQVDQLTAAVLTHRATEAELADQRATAVRHDDTRTELARQALVQLGEGMKAFLVSKGLTPEMSEVMGVLGQNAELAAALQDPDVRLLIQDPGNVSALALMLKQAGSQARMARESKSP
jgi:hypothetical protein